MKYYKYAIGENNVSHIYYESREIAKLTSGNFNDFWSIDHNQNPSTGAVIFKEPKRAQNHLILKYYVL